MSEQEPIPEPIKTENTHVTKKRSSLLKYLAFFLFFAIIAFGIWSAVSKNYEEYKNIVLRTAGFESQDKTPKEEIIVQREEIPPLPPVPEAEPYAPTIFIDPEHKEDTEILSLRDKLENLEIQNKALTLYIAARELKEKIHSPQDFAVQLEFISDLAIGEADIEGRVDILRQSSENGLATADMLIAELDKIEVAIDDKQEKTFWGSVKNSFNGLIKITKVEGSVEGDDYAAVIKRAKIAVEKADYAAAVTEAEKLGAPASTFVKKANNLQRVTEITESLIEFSKSRFHGREITAEPEVE